MTPQALKASVLQLAIQGKLVPQRPEEGTAEELYQQIQAEKQALIANGTIKREKALEPIKADEIPFDIPETWKWVRLGNLIRFNGGYAFKSNEYSNEGIRIIRISDFSSEGIIDKQIVRHKMNPALFPFMLQQDDILLCMTGGTVGKSCYISHISEPLVTNQRVGTIRSIICLAQYIYQCITTPHIQEKISQSKNSTNDNISATTIYSFLIPLPPLEEQKRIVAKIEEMLPLIDRYGEAYTKLETFNKRFPNDLRKSILQEAIQGKLVPQLPEEGTGEELYQQIQAEKQRLIAAGSIKKEKLLPPIEEKDLPFDIPETWKWVRLGDVCRMDLGKTPPRAETEWWDGTIPWVSIADMLEGGHISTTKESVSSKAISCVFSEKISKAGTLLMSFKLTIGRVSILDIDAVHNEAIVSIYPHHDQERAFQHYLFSVLPLISKEGNFKNAIKGKTLNKGSLNNLLLPLPPLAEQKRIVAKIEEMLTLCKELS